MKSSKFFTLLRTLNDKEAQAFHKYLRQLHGGGHMALRVFEYLQRLGPDFADDKKLDLAYAHWKIFGEELVAGNRKRILNTLSELHGWLKDFLLSEKVRDDSLESQLLWLEVLQERRLPEEHAKQSAQFYRATKAAPKKDAKKYLMEMAASYFHYQQLAQVIPIPDINALQQCLDSLETCAETVRLRLACQLANIRKVRRPKFPLPAPPLRLPEARVISSSPLLTLYNDIYQLIETEQEKHYDRIEAVFFQEHQLDADELHGALGYLHNYVAIQMRHGIENNINQKIHTLNRRGLQHGLFKGPADMSATQFANIVALACSVQDHQWATFFVDDRQGALPEHLRADTILLARAAIQFSKGNFKQVLDLLSPVEFKGLYQVIRSKFLILRSYVELGKEDALTYCTNFEALLGRYRKPKTDAVEAALESVRITKMLILKKHPQQQVLDRIEEATNLHLRPWLKKKAAGYTAEYAPSKQKR